MGIIASFAQLIAPFIFLSPEGGNFNISSLEAEEDNIVIVDIEPPKPKRKKIATLKVFILYYMIIPQILCNNCVN